MSDSNHIKKHPNQQFYEFVSGCLGGNYTPHYLQFFTLK